MAGKLPTIKTRPFYADKIGGALGKSVEGFVEAGRWLIDAKKELLHGEFEAMLRDDLNMSPSTSRKLRIIAENPVIANRSHANALPARWDTLYLLTQIEPKVLQAAIKDGRVNPKMDVEAPGYVNACPEISTASGRRKFFVRC